LDEIEIKRKLRKLKRLEIDLRLNVKMQPYSVLIWDIFFDLHNVSKGRAKYPLAKLLSADSEKYKRIIDEYLSFVYSEIYKENETQKIKRYDSDALVQLDLPFDANEMDIKRRFHELAKIYHPDTGGDTGKFIKLMEIYKKLIN
jgi:hypothetical protein